MPTRRRFLAGTAAAVAGGLGAAALLTLDRAGAPPPHGITIDAGTVVRHRPPGIGGVNINAHTPEFATGAGGIDYQGDLRAAGVRLVRTVTYPDTQSVGHDLAYFDRNVAAIERAGATPLLVQYIKPDLPFLDEGGGAGGTIASNLLFLVRRYLGPPYSLATQYWEIGNEPDFPIDYQVSSPAEYVATFNACHDALVAAGLRHHVVLCGPAVSAPYRWPGAGGANTRLIDAVLVGCARSVDVLTYHHYAAPAPTREALLNVPSELDALEDGVAVSGTAGLVASHGMEALLARMREVRFERPDVGVGVTEHNTDAFQHDIASGLWNLALTQQYLYNPHGRITAAFVFDDYGAQQGGYGHYDVLRQRDYCYWALWINGNLRGSEVLARAVAGPLNEFGRSSLLVTATRDTATLNVEVINRSASPLHAQVSIAGASLSGAATLHTMAAGTLPVRGTPMRLGSRFTYQFPPLSASIFRYPRGRSITSP